MSPFSRLRVDVLPAFRDGFLAIEGNGVYQLVEPFTYQDRVVGEITVPAGFKTDFCSIPFFARAFFPVSGKAAPAGLLHDYCLGEQTGLRKQASRIFLRALKDGGVPAWRRYPMFAFVFIFTAFDVYG